MKEVDWSDTGEWNALHLAIKHDVESLKVSKYKIQGSQAEHCMSQCSVKQSFVWVTIESVGIVWVNVLS